MDHLFHIAPDRIANAAAYRVARGAGSYSADENARALTARLTNAARLLGAGAFIGCQLDAADASACVFSSASADASAEDLAWIFRPCGAVSADPAADRTERFEADRFLYALVSCQAELSAGEVEDKWPADISEELLRAMTEAGVLLRVLVGSDKTAAHGCLLFSLPQPMSLRLKSMLAISFPYTTLLELGGASAPSADVEPLRGVVLKGVISHLFRALMRLPQADDDTEDDNDEFLSDADTGTPLEALGLSVRSFCCLKRAGYVTVEQVAPLSAEELLRVRNLNQKCVSEIREKLNKYLLDHKLTADQDEWDELEPDAPQPVDHAMLLESLIGLKEAKEQVARITAFARMKQAFAATGKADLGIALNMAFVGNPGTAKTTVARLVAGLLHEIGLLPESEILEVGRADLVARYVGQTAARVKDVFDKAKGRVLFIDEAYALLDNRAGSFGDEAIHTIVQEMENHRHETVVIFAGYPDEMKAFLDRNPGLRSRVPFTVYFDDYSAEELLQITEAEAKKRGFTVSDEACAKVKRFCLREAGRPEGGNGRFCRNLVENAILSYAVRVCGAGQATDGGDCVLTPDDFSVAGIASEVSRAPIGFCA